MFSASSYAPVQTEDRALTVEPDNTPESVDLETVEKALKEHYCTAGELTFYTECSCVIKRGHDEHTSSSDDIIEEQFLQSNKRVVIIGEEGFGKTYLLQYVLQQWATGIILNDVILIYIKLHGLSRNSCIFGRSGKVDEGNNSVYKSSFQCHARKRCTRAS